MNATIKDAILDLFVGAGYDVDVYVKNVYQAVYEEVSTVPLRRQQQRLGARFSIINRDFANGKQTQGRIVPGEMKRTYRLVRS